MSETNGQIDMTQPYGVQMEGLAVALRGFVASNEGSFTTLHTLSGDWPEHSKEVQTYTRAQVNGAIKRFFKAAQAGAKYASGLPTTPNKTGMVDGLAFTYTVTRGANKGQVRNLVMNALAGVRRAHKRAAKVARTEASVEAAVSTGSEWRVADTDKVFASQAKAAKAYCRATYGGDWWATDKDTRLSVGMEAAYQGALQTDVEVVRSMNGAKVVAIARKAGAPDSVHKGRGATDRSTEWCINNPDAVMQYLD